MKYVRADDIFLIAPRAICPPAADEWCFTWCFAERTRCSFFFLFCREKALRVPPAAARPCRFITSTSYRSAMAASGRLRTAWRPGDICRASCLSDKTRALYLNQNLFLSVNGQNTATTKNKLVFAVCLVKYFEDRLSETILSFP